MPVYTQIRYTYFLPLPQIYTKSEFIRQEFDWLSDKPESFKCMKQRVCVIRNFSKMRYDKRLTYPLFMKDKQVRTFRELPFSPLMYLLSKQKKVPFKIINNENSINAIEHKNLNLSFSIRLYQIGFAVISVYLSFPCIIDSINCSHLLKDIKFGKKMTTINKYISHLKLALLRSLFREETLGKIQTSIVGPKIRVNIVANEIAADIRDNTINSFLGSKNTKLNVTIFENEHTGDVIASNKKGMIVFTNLDLEKSRRTYFRNSLDFLLDLVFGSDYLMQLMAEIVTKQDVFNRYENLETLIFTAVYSLNPGILRSNKAFSSLLPSEGFKKFYRFIIEATKFTETYEKAVTKLLERVNEIRIDKWYEITKMILVENIPYATSQLMKQLETQKISMREILTPKINLDEVNLTIMNHLLERLVIDYSKRFDDLQPTNIPKENLGYATLSKIQNAIGFSGRDHLEYKNRMNILCQVGLLQSKIYDGPGSRKGSLQYRAAPNHPYVNGYLRIHLTKKVISTLII